MTHEGLVSLFRNRPTLAPELLQGPLGVPLPTCSEARVESSDFTQLVADPSAIPLILGKQAAGRDPELAVLSALAHGDDPKLAPGLFEAVLSSARRLDIERFAFYVDLAVSAFSGAARKALEAYMQSGSYEYQSELVRKR